MIQEEFKVEKKEKASYPPLPKNVYQVELLDITDKRNPTYDTKNLPEDKRIYETVLDFQFTILKGSEKTADETKDLRCRNIWENFVPNYLYEGKNGKNKLWKIVEATLGRDLTPEDEATLDSKALNSLVGSQLRVTTGHKEGKNNVVYDTITEYLPAEEKLPQLTEEEIEKCRVKKEEAEKQPENKTTKNFDAMSDEDTSTPVLSDKEQNEILDTLGKTI